MNASEIKESELLETTTCAICGKPLIDQGFGPTFYTFRMSHACLKLDAIARRAGVGLLVGDRLAQVMGPDEALSERIGAVKIFVVHETCMSTRIMLYDIVAKFEEK